MFRRKVLWAPGLLALVGGLCAAAPAAAQGEGVVRGRVLTANGDPAADAQVRIVSLGRRSGVDAQGEFIFERVPAGSYLVEVISLRSGQGLKRVAVQPGSTVEVEIVLRPAVHLEQVVVTAGPEARQRSELYGAATALSGLELSTEVRASLGETLARQPGVTSTYFGPGSSRPVIRGLGGSRVRVLENGVGTGDASDTSPDHAVSLDPLSADRIEIIRGPATLLYGSAAIGGVVNVLDRRVPSELPTRPVEGTVQGLGGTVADEFNGAIVLDGALGSVGWHASGLRRSTDDYAIPGHAELEHEEEEPGVEEEEEPEGILENSALEATRGAFGLSYVGPRGYIGASVLAHDTEYGIPGHGHEEEGEEEEEEEAVTIDLRQRRVDFDAAWRLGGAVLRGITARLGIADYEHKELEGAEVGTVFSNESWESRVELEHGVGPLSGAVGFQVSNRDFAAIGEEAFVPPTDTDMWAVFLFEEVVSGPVRYQFGARYERQNVAEPASGFDRSSDGVSLSGGVNWSPVQPLTLALSVARSVKLPTAEELFSNGPHLATQAFEVGDPDLGSEKGISVDASVRVAGGPVRGEVTVFATRFDDFIFQAFTGEEEDELPVLVYTQDDAVFRGFEAEAELELLHRGPHHLALRGWADYVRAHLTGSGDPLPRIPPLRFGTGLGYEGGPLRAEVGVRRVTAQDRLGLFEEPTPGYTMLDASASYRLFTGLVMHEVIVRGTNLTDEDARNHVSLLKEVAPLPGRDLALIYRLTF